MTPSDDVIKHLTDKHIIRFEKRVAAKKQDPNVPVNLEECQYYLNLWTSIREKKHSWSALDLVEQREVLEALDDEASG